MLTCCNVRYCRPCSFHPFLQRLSQQFSPSWRGYGSAISPLQVSWVSSKWDRRHEGCRLRLGPEFWVSLDHIDICFPFKKSEDSLFRRTSSIKVNQFNIFQWNYSISLSITSCHIISSFILHAWPTRLAQLIGMRYYIRCRQMFLPQSPLLELRWSTEIMISRCRFLRQEPEWNTSFFYPTIWRVRRWWRSRSDWTGKRWNLPKLGIGKRSHSFSAQSLRRPWTTWHVVDWRGHASMLCLLWRPRFLTFFMTLLLGSYGVAQERDAHEVRSWALEDERDYHRYRCV